MRMSKLLTTVAVASVVLIGGCNKETDPNLILGMSSETMLAALQQKGGTLAAVNLGSAGNYVILAKSGISTTGTTLITGNIGVSPIAAIGLTGFGLTMDVSNTFSTSALVTGKVYASDYAVPTPATMTTAISDMQTAYTTANGLAPDVTELGAGNIGGMTLAPGIYKWGTGLTIPTDVTLSGSSNDVWIFQIAQTLDISSATKVILSGGAQAKNIFWIVAGQTTLGTTSVFNGNILDQTNIAIQTGAVLNGRALAQTAVTLDANTITNTESKKECEGFLNAEKKAFDDGQKTAKNLFDDGQKDEKNIFELTNPTSADKEVFDVAQKTAKNTFDVTQNTAKLAFAAQQKTDAEKCKTLS